MQKGSKTRHQRSKKGRKVSDYRTPPSDLPGQPPPSQPSQESLTSSAVKRTRSSHHRSRVSPKSSQSSLLPTVQSPSRVPAAPASSTVSSPLLPPPLTSASASMAAVGPSPLAPATSVFAPAYSEPAAPPSLPAPRTPRASVYPKQSIPSASEALPRPQAPPTISQGAERTLQTGGRVPIGCDAKGVLAAADGAAVTAITASFR
ncbi:hypothetical protein MTO96_009360 [Rhipicephalus appendiculatus]